MQLIGSPDDLLLIYQDKTQNAAFLAELRGKVCEQAQFKLADPRPVIQRACDVFQMPSAREPRPNSVAGIMRSCIRQLNERGDLSATDIIKTHIALLHVLNKWMKSLEGATITFIAAILNGTDSKTMSYSDMVAVFDVMKKQYPIPGVPVMDGAARNAARRGEQKIDVTVQDLIRELGAERAHALIVDYIRTKLGQAPVVEMLAPPPAPLTDSVIASAPLPPPLHQAPEPPPAPPIVTPRQRAVTQSVVRAGDGDLFASIRQRATTLHHVEVGSAKAEPSAQDKLLASIRQGVGLRAVSPQEQARPVAKKPALLAAIEAGTILHHVASSDKLSAAHDENPLLAEIRAGKQLRHVRPDARPKVLDDVAQALSDKMASMRRGLEESDFDPTALSESWLDATADEPVDAVVKDPLLDDWVELGA